jgi:hypothetical protein
MVKDGHQQMQKESDRYSSLVYCLQRIQILHRLQHEETGKSMEEKTLAQPE